MSQATIRRDIARSLDAKRKTLEGIKLAQACIEGTVAEVKGRPDDTLARLFRTSGAKLPEYLDHGRHHSPEAERVEAFARGMLFVAAVTETEAALTAVIRAVLMAFPQKISTKKQAGGDDIFILSPRDRRVRLVEQDLTATFYAKPEDYFNRMADLISLPQTTLADERSVFIEAKARRDLGMHNEWVRNAVYQSKVGKLAQVPMDATKDRRGHLHPTSTYLVRVLDSFDQLLACIASHCDDQFARFSRASVFREMWERSSLNHVVPFDEVWGIGADGEIFRRPNFEWCWSGSEGMLLSFFERVVHGKPTTVEDAWLDRMQSRLSDSDLEIVWEWLVEPFYF